MTLTLRAVSLNDRPLSQPITAHFDEAGGTIGRADHNTMALPDPERHISRQQAAISATPEGYTICNVGSANPVVVRGRPLARGETALLGRSDLVRIGGYVLEVLDSEDTLAAEAVTRGRAAVEAATPLPRQAGAPAGPLGRDPRDARDLRDTHGNGLPGAADLAMPLGRDNPFADLVPPAWPSADAPAAAPPAAPAAPAAAAARPAWPAELPTGFAAPAGLRADSPAIARPPPAPPAALPDDFDPFAPAPLPADAPPRAAPPGTFDDLIPVADDAPSIDRLLGPDAAHAFGRFLDGADAGPADPLRGVPLDPSALFREPGAAPVPPAPVAAPVPDHVPLGHALFRPPLPAATPAPAEPAREPPAPAATRPAPLQPAGAGTADAAAEPDAGRLWQAFCDGAQVHPGGGLTPERMRMIGKLLRSAVDGAVKLTALRAASRHEMHAEVTVIRSRNNNPLKFSPDGQAALEQLLQPPMRGFLEGPAAMTDTMEDLVGHAIGTVSGTRAALEGVLHRFTPEALEAKLTTKHLLDSLLPMNRKARLWELYLQHYRAIHDEAQEDFHTLFGKAFLAAYEQQVERLRQERPPAER